MSLDLDEFRAELVKAPTSDRLYVQGFALIAELRVSRKVVEAARELLGGLEDQHVDDYTDIVVHAVHVEDEMRLRAALEELTTVNVKGDSE